MYRRKKRRKGGWIEGRIKRKKGGRRGGLNGSKN